MGERGLFYGWIVVGAAATVSGIGIATLFSLAVFLQPIEQSMGWSRGAISAIALLNWLSMGLGSFAWGALSDRIGARGVAVSGGLLIGLGLILSSQAQAVWHLYVSFGFMVGFSVGAFHAPLISTATKWFTARRGLAVALVSCGMGLGILLGPPTARALINAYDWRIAMVILGDAAWLLIIPIALLLRSTPGEMGTQAKGGAAAAGAEYRTAEVIAMPQFWAIAVTHLACCAAHSGPIFHMVTHAIDQGIPGMTAATILGISGLASVAGRIGGGLLADRVGAKLTIASGLTLQAAAIVAYLLARDAVAFYALALVFGAAYGLVMPLYALVTREYFGEKVMGTAYGAIFFISTLGMGLGSFAGGWIYDRLGSYVWLYGGSFAIAALAVSLAFTFRPPRPALGLTQAAP